MIITPTSSRPWDSILFDIVGPLEKSVSGNVYMLVVIDVHTHFPEAFPLRSTESKKIATELVKLFSRVGIPSRVQSDQAQNFLSTLMQHLFRMLGVKHIKSSPFHAQSNALVERLNGTIKKLLKTCLVGKDIRRWDELLPLVLFAIRSSKHESTGFSPFELMYGYEIRGPLDIVRELWAEEDKESPVNLHQYVMDLRATMRELRKQALETEVVAKEEAKVRYDQKAELVEYKEGALPPTP